MQRVQPLSIDKESPDAQRRIEFNELIEQNMHLVCYGPEYDRGVTEYLLDARRTIANFDDASAGYWMDLAKTRAQSVNDRRTSRARLRA